MYTDISDLEAVQQRLKATRTVFHYILDNRETLLPSDHKFRSNVQLLPNDDLAQHSVFDDQTMDASAIEDDWDEISSVQEAHHDLTAPTRVAVRSIHREGVSSSSIAKQRA